MSLNCCSQVLRCHLRSVMGIMGPVHQKCAALWRMLRINNPANDVTLAHLIWFILIFVQAFIKCNCIQERTGCIVITIVIFHWYRAIRPHVEGARSSQSEQVCDKWLRDKSYNSAGSYCMNFLSCVPLIVLHRAAICLVYIAIQDWNSRRVITVQKITAVDVTVYLVKQQQVWKHYNFGKNYITITHY